MNNPEPPQFYRNKQGTEYVVLRTTTAKVAIFACFVLGFIIGLVLGLGLMFYA